MSNWQSRLGNPPGSMNLNAMFVLDTNIVSEVMRQNPHPGVLAQVLFRTPPTQRPVSGGAYFCRDFKRQLKYPEILYDDNRCERSHEAGG